MNKTIEELTEQLEAIDHELNLTDVPRSKNGKELDTVERVAMLVGSYWGVQALLETRLRDLVMSPSGQIVCKPPTKKRRNRKYHG